MVCCACLLCLPGCDSKSGPAAAEAEVRGLVRKTSDSIDAGNSLAAVDMLHSYLAAPPGRGYVSDSLLTVVYNMAGDIYFDHENFAVL